MTYVVVKLSTIAKKYSHCTLKNSKQLLLHVTLVMGVFAIILANKHFIIGHKFQLNFTQDYILYNAAKFCNISDNISLIINKLILF